MRSGAGLSEDTKRRYAREAEFTRAEDHATLPRNRRGFRKRLQYPCGLVNNKEGTKTKHDGPLTAIARTALPVVS